MKLYLRKPLGYLVPVFALSCFMLLIYGAYVPHKAAEIQKVVCIKFKSGISQAQIEQHFNDFAAMKNQMRDVVAYSAGQVQSDAQFPEAYDVVHYLTFRSAESADLYAKHEIQQKFMADHRDQWADILELNSNIEKKK
ncbi:Dabb family protein [Dyadobacter tibetensis]|uniref:Dabb family protein n=1 Tax=Dyadobacter tibetensis TaxID=1211851 RepID=UPI00046FBE3F|nr:Dabb family protein [Dyadobacter tibetensis]